MSMRVEKLSGFVVHAFPLGEADQIITCFSSAGNLVKFVAKGSRKVKSRFAASVQLFNLGEYIIYRGRGLPILRQAEIIDSFMPVRRDWSKCGAAFALMELCRLLVAEQAGETNAFRLVLAYLLHIKEHSYKPLAFDGFRLQFAASLGYEMSFDRCTLCGSEIDLSAWLHWPAGGAICPNCRTGIETSNLSRTDQLVLLGFLQASDFATIDGIAATEAQNHACAEIVDHLIFWLTEGKTKAQAFRKLFEEGH